jgi:thiazole/oxazole-forming peptide maturase SagD family component
MLSYYPSHIHLKNNYQRIGGQHAGIVESQLLLCNVQPAAPELAICANQMPHYEQILISDAAKINYHLSGYGMYREEALVKLYGESVERYALLAASTMWQDKVVYYSYRQMAARHDILPWEYLQIFSDEDYAALAKKTNIRPITQDDVIGWLECPSLVSAGKTTFIPMQYLFLGYQVREDLGEKIFVPSFSKGSATHVNICKALQSAIMEAVEADAFMLNWYTNVKSRRLEVDDLDLLRVTDQIIGKTPYDLTLYDFSMEDLPGTVLAAQLTNTARKAPYILMGCSANLSPHRAAYRALAEASTIHYLAANGPLMNPTDFLSKDNDSFLNLDSNVAYWTRAENQDQKAKILDSIWEGEAALSGLPDQAAGSDKEDLTNILKKIAKISNYAVYLDITPPEIAGQGLTVMRVFIPELVQLSYPGFPYSRHPRVLQAGGITNDFPHPMP